VGGLNIIIVIINALSRYKFTLDIEIAVENAGYKQYSIIKQRNYDSIILILQIQCLAKQKLITDLLILKKQVGKLQYY